MERITTIFGGQWTGPLTAANAVQVAGNFRQRCRGQGRHVASCRNCCWPGGHLGLPDKTVQRTRRYRTAVAVATLLHGLAGQDPAALTFLAHATLDTSAAAMRKACSQLLR